MPIPNLTNEGFLPEGIHDCTLDEVGARFGKFQVSDRRVRLFGKLCKLVEEERQAGLATGLIIDGSFVTNAPQPGDIDLLVVLPEDYDLHVERPPFQYNVLSQKRARRIYGFDLIAVRQSSIEYQTRLDFFTQVKDVLDQRKGLLRIKL